jgi:hypothetical protein
MSMAEEHIREGRGNTPRRLTGAERSLLSRLNRAVRTADLMAVLMVLATAMSAFATWRSARISNLIFLVAERPYIGVERVSLEHLQRGGARIVIDYRNFGHIPAADTSVSAAIITDDEPAAGQAGSDAGVISPAVEHHLYSYLSEDFFRAVAGGRAKLAVRVKATYRGPSGDRFCYLERFAYDQRSEWFSAAGGSDKCAEEPN